MAPPMAVPPPPGNPCKPLLPALIVAGPTASGKSALALALARTLRGTIINVDAMQTYAELRIITARPSPEEEAEIPHALYGVRTAAEPGNAAWWRIEALAAMDTATRAGRLPILCGGTGLYFSALTQGIAEIPDPGMQARTDARDRLAARGAEALHADLMRADPETAAKLRPTDSQRLARAWEVLTGTGKGLAAWQRAPNLPPAPYGFKAILLDPPRDALRAAIAARFGDMLAAGALDEVRALLARNLPATLPAMRAHGVPELAAYLRGDVTLAQAEARACLVTAQYTKRQATWFRHQTLAPAEATRTILSRIRSEEQFSETITHDLKNFLPAPVDAPQQPA